MVRSALSSIFARKCTRFSSLLLAGLSAVCLTVVSAQDDEDAEMMPSSADVRMRVKVPTVRIPFTKKPPTIDGKMQTDEWQDAAAYTGFWQDFGGGNFAYLATREKQATFWVAYDKEFLYFAHRSVVFPQGAWLKCKGKFHDVDGHPRYGTLWDDHVELCVTPTSDSRANLKKGIFKFMLNPIDTFSDFFVDWRDGPPNWDYGWESECVVKNAWDKDAWVSELKTPLKKFIYEYHDAKDENGQPAVRVPIPDGTAWLPNECDARIRANWFWNTRNAPTLKSVDQLMDMYYRSVGHGAVLLLNHTPDTTGRIPEADVKRAAEFGAEIRRRFGRSLADTGGQGATVELTLERPTLIDHVITMEDVRQGERVRRYVVEGLLDGKWQPLCEGTAIGHKKIDRFPITQVSRVRLRVSASAAEPRIRKLAVYRVGAVPETPVFHDNADTVKIGAIGDRGGSRRLSVFEGVIDEARVYNRALSDRELADLATPSGAGGGEVSHKAWQWTPKNIDVDGKTVEIDITPWCKEAGQYTVRFRQTGGRHGIEVKSLTLLQDGRPSPEWVERGKQPGTFVVTLPGVGVPLRLRASLRAPHGTDRRGDVLIGK